MIATVFRSFSAMLSILFLTCAAASGPETIAPSPVSLPAPPDPPVVPLPPEFQQAPRAAKAFATGDFGSLDLSDRQLSAAFYRSVFAASEDTEIDWTGEVAGCMPGDTSDGFKDAVLTRVNWYRAMAGVPDTVVFQTGPGSYSEKAQDAALIMSSNNLLSHYPNSSLDCYSAEGADAARHSNLSLGRNGWNAVTGQMQDNGANNSRVGHRRWILYPQTRIMGTGDIPETSGHRDTNALWVFDSHYSDPRPATRDNFVAWPPPGYVPYQVVYPRWSFSYPGADFSAATVALSRGGEPVAVALEPGADGFGENTLVWVAGGLSPTGHEHWPASGSDTAIDVTIRNVRVGGATQDFAYRVIIFDPSTVDVSVQISGPGAVGLGGADYSHTTLGFGDGYRLREIRLEGAPGAEGAEEGGARIIDRTNADYPLISNQAKASGGYAFHLAHTSFATQSFEIDRDYVLSAQSRLRFSTRLGWASSVQTARVQISFDDGASWTDLYAQSGSNSAGESSFTSRTISLAGYANRVGRIRVVYAVGFGTYYPQSDAGAGFFVDDIEVTNAREMGAIKLYPLGSGGRFTYTPSAAGEYGLQVQAQPWRGFPGLDWSPLHNVQVSGGPPGSGEGALQLVDARYFYSEPAAVDGSGTLGKQTWGSHCDMTLMALDPTSGAVDIDLERNGAVERYRDTIDAQAAMFVYALYNPGTQGFALSSASGGESRVTAFYYCFQGTGNYQLSDARYLYDQAVGAGSGPLADQGWKGVCDMTLMALDVVSGAVNIDLERNGAVVRYPDTIRAQDAMFVYSLYNQGSQGFRLSPSGQGESKATAFYYCFNKQGG